MFLYYASNFFSEELSLYQCGEEACSPKHSFGPAIRNFFLIHCILHGKGTYCRGNFSYSLGPGDAFLILPGESTFYQADSQDPWHYIWAGFQGSKAEEILAAAGLEKERVVFHCGTDSDAFLALKNLCSYAAKDSPNDFALLGHLYWFLSQLTKPDFVPPQPLKSGEYYEKAIQFISTNYADPISVPMIAKAVGIHRSYLFRVFKENAGISPQKFLTQYRIQKAKELLDTTSLNITEVAFSTGFQDPGYFSKVFRTVSGTSPREYETREKAILYSTVEP